MESTHAPGTDASPLNAAMLARLYGEDDTRFDLSGGTIRRSDVERQLFIGTETLNGIHRALDEETGEAWRIVMRNCGHDWGRRIMARIELDLQRATDRGLDGLTVAEFLELVGTWFRFHGWGRIEFDLDRTEDAGIVVARVHDSLVTEALADESGPVDHLVEGMLCAVLEGISERELACLQITSERRRQGTIGEFVISARPRIEAIEELAGRASLDEALQELEAA